MYYIVGLGNPGKEYEGTRHNVGFTALDFFASKYSFSSWHKSGSNQGVSSKGLVDAVPVALLKPSTFMNESGLAVRAFVEKGKEERLVVVYDDVDLALGEIKISFDRGAGGHNGITSIIDRLGTQAFIRVRVGVAGKSFFTGAPRRPKGAALPKFVLAPFGKREQKMLDTALNKVTDALSSILAEGKDIAMNRFN